MPNEIKFNDIFDNNVQSGFTAMNKSLSEFNKNLLKTTKMDVGSGKESCVNPEILGDFLNTEVKYNITGGMIKIQSQGVSLNFFSLPSFTVE